MRFFGFILLLFLWSCKNENTPQSQINTSPKQIAIPKFERDTAYNFVASQVAFGPRVPNTDGHEACKQWIISKLKAFGAVVKEQNFKATTYDNRQLDGTNIIGQYNTSSNNRILLAAHWDTRHIADSPRSVERRNEPILGADDGGSGVAVLLEIARQLNSNPIDLGVDFIFFDVEDHGEPHGEEISNEQEIFWCLGSQYWSKNPHRKDFKFGILLDMVGSKTARFPKEGYSMRFAEPIVKKVWSLAERMGHNNFFVNAEATGVTDDHLFVNLNAKIPMIDIINLPESISNIAFGDHWHTHDDNMEIINSRTLGAVGQVVLAVLYRESNGTL